MTKKKKIIILASMVLLLVVTTTLNIVLGVMANGSKADGGSGTVSTGNFFTDYRADRKTTRDEQMLYLDSILANATLSETAKKDAATQKLALASLMEVETILEGLLKANGYDDAVVSVSANSNNVYVIVKSAELTSAQSDKIFDMIMAERKDIDMNSIRVTPVE